MLTNHCIGLQGCINHIFHLGRVNTIKSAQRTYYSVTYIIMCGIS